MPAFALQFLKKYWQVILLVVVLVVGYAWIRRQQADFAKAIADLNNAHQVEVEKISQARAQEVKEHEAQLKQLQESVAKIQADYAAAQEALHQQQAHRAGEIVKKYGGDADGLAKVLADTMGFVVVKPASP